MHTTLVHLGISMPPSIFQNFVQNTLDRFCILHLVCNSPVHKQVVVFLSYLYQPLPNSSGGITDFYISRCRWTNTNINPALHSQRPRRNRRSSSFMLICVQVGRPWLHWPLRSVA